MSEFVLAVDIGGTKLAAARVALDGTVTHHAQAPTVETKDAEELYAALLTVLDEVAGDDQPVGVGVGCGGPMEWPSGRVSPLNIPAWRGFPLRERLAQRFPKLRVRVHNDAVAMAVGEHWVGAGRGTASFLGMVVSTGVGGGLIVDGRVIDGPGGNAGHVGHVVVDPHGPACACGGRGCLEAIARGPAVVAWALSEGWEPEPGQPADGRALVASAHRGHPVALAALTRAGQAIGVAVASAASLLELEVVAVGGGLANAGSLLLGPAQDAFTRHAGLDFAATCRIVPAVLGADAGLVGAAAFVLAGDRYWAGD